MFPVGLSSAFTPHVRPRRDRARRAEPNRPHERREGEVSPVLARRVGGGHAGDSDQSDLTNYSGSGSNSHEDSKKLACCGFGPLRWCAGSWNDKRQTDLDSASCAAPESPTQSTAKEVVFPFMHGRRADQLFKSSGPWLTPVLIVTCITAIRRAPACAQSTEPLSPLQIERTERLLESHISCRGCHVIAGDGGAIGPVLDGISNRAELDYVRAVIDDPSTIPGSIMPHQAMSNGDADRLSRYIHQQPASAEANPTAPRAPGALGPGEENDGAALYARHCAACHGATGQGDGWNAARLPVQPTRHTDPATMSQRPDNILYEGMAAGGYVPARSARMPAFGALLTDSPIRALVEHIRMLCDCTQPAWAGGGR